MSNTLSLQDVSIRYGTVTVVDSIHLVVEQGQIACLLGPSGCGKTTLLRAIVGFEAVAKGTICLNDAPISTPNFTVPTEQRNIGMVFQDYALFPHLTVAANISFGMKHASKADKQQRVRELLALTNLSHCEHRYPHELSGGQQQRVALARALAPRPRLLLLDEPFASQDVALRETLAREVRAILKHEQTTAILVTHDQHEAFAMADCIGVMQAGRLQQWADAPTLYSEPCNPFVAQFIGQGALISGYVRDANTLETAFGTLTSVSSITCNAGDTVQLLLRPHHIEISPYAAFQAKIKNSQYRGADYLYTLQLNNDETVLAQSTLRFELDCQVNFNVIPHEWVVLR